MILVSGFDSNRSVGEELECVGEEIEQSSPTGHGPRTTRLMQLLDLSDLADPQGRFARLLKSSSENMLNLARAVTKDSQGSMRRSPRCR
jgi:hypothetical protein